MRINFVYKIVSLHLTRAKPYLVKLIHKNTAPIIIFNPTLLPNSPLKLTAYNLRQTAAADS